MSLFIARQKHWNITGKHSQIKDTTWGRSTAYCICIYWEVSPQFTLVSLVNAEGEYILCKTSSANLLESTGLVEFLVAEKKIHPFDLIMFINTGSSQLFTGIPGFDGWYALVTQSPGVTQSHPPSPASPPAAASSTCRRHGRGAAKGGGRLLWWAPTERPGPEWKEIPSGNLT